MPYGRLALRPMGSAEMARLVEREPILAKVDTEGAELSILEALSRSSRAWRTSRRGRARVVAALCE